MKRKKFTTYKRLAVSLMCLVCVASGIATASFSFSWFSNKNNVTRNINGYTAGAYFAGGSGKENDPYIIKNPIHLYNLAWLYYIGYFKGEEPYFSISNDLNMSGWTLPPIGTSTNPFNGHLNGHGKKISGLTISNDFDKLKNKKPSMVTESDWNGSNAKYGPTPNILGLFGYVSKESKGIPSIENVYINNETVNSVTTTALVGIVAGYVDGKLDKIYIDNSSIDVGDETSSLGTLNDETVSNVSEYTSVGYCTEAYRTKYIRYETTLYEPCYVASTSKDTYKKGGQGQDVGEGGSIDFATLSKRVTYIIKSQNIDKSETTSTSYTYESSAYNAYLYTTYKSKQSDRGYEWDKNISLQTVAFQQLSSAKTTYFPLNIDKVKATVDSTTPENALGTYYTGNKQDHGEPLANTNTGYIVGYNTTTNATPRLNHKRSNAKSTGIKYSIGSQSKGNDLTNDTLFDGSNISLFYCEEKAVESQGKTEIKFLTERIADSDYASSNFNNPSSEDYGGTVNLNDLNFTDFADTKESFRQLLKDGTTSALLSEGYVGLNYLQFFKTGSITSPITLSKVSFYGKSYDSYQAYPGGINFSIASSGFVMKLIVANMTTSPKSTLPNIYRVNRSSDKTSISEKPNLIYKVYKNKTNKNDCVFYSDSDSSDQYENDNNYEQIIDLNSMYSTECFIQECAYYFEIPLPVGDYFITAATDANKGSSALYLDICANAGDGGSSGETVTRTKVFELLEQITQAFTYPTGVYIADFDNAVLDTKTLAITLGTKYSGEAKITRTNNNADVIVTSDTNTNTGVSYYDLDFTVTNNGSTITDSDVLSVEKTITQTKRMTYYDYDTDDSTLRMFRFSQTKEGNGDYSSVTAETQYLATYSDSTLSSWEETSDQTVYNDDGTSTSETNGIPAPIATDGIAIPDDFSTSTNVFNLALKQNKKDDFSNIYLSSVTFDDDTHKTAIDGYLFTIINESKTISSTDYKLDRNTKYSLQINDDTYAKA